MVLLHIRPLVKNILTEEQEQTELIRLDQASIFIRIMSNVNSQTLKGLLFYVQLIGKKQDTNFQQTNLRGVVMPTVSRNE